MRYSIVWKIREKGVVVFRHEFDHDHDSIEAALLEFRRHEPDAYVVRVYKHEPIDPYLMAGLLEHLEKRAVEDGWRSTGD